MILFIEKQDSGSLDLVRSKAPHGGQHGADSSSVTVIMLGFMSLSGSVQESCGHAEMLASLEKKNQAISIFMEIWHFPSD